MLHFLTVLQLVLRENDLIELPKQIGDLARLRELHIQGNRLTVLPPELGKPNTVSITLNKAFVSFEDTWWYFWWRLSYRESGLSE